MNTFNMKIANNAPKTKNGVYPFSEKSINNIPYLPIFIEEEANKIITEACKYVLKTSMSSKNPYRYGEVGLLVSVINKDRKGNQIEKIRKPFAGSYHTISLNEGYSNIIKSRHELVDDLVFVHNHPNNSSLSGGDLIRLSEDKSLISVIAVGNKHNIFVVNKNSSTLKISEFINKYINDNIQNYNNEDEKRILRNKAGNIILSNPEHFNIDYYRFERSNNNE